jgi:hypothetical protein
MPNLSSAIELVMKDGVGRDFGSNKMAMSEANVVLTHGAWADGSSWARVITALKTEGAKASAAPLPLTISCR